MKIFGGILIAVGILMFVFNSFSFKTKEKVVALGPIEVNKEKKHAVGWPTYAGGIIILAGITMLAIDKKK